MTAGGGGLAGGRGNPPRCAQAVVLGSPGEDAQFPRALRGGAELEARDPRPAALQAG